MFDMKKNLMFELIPQVPVGSGIRIGFLNSDRLDPDRESDPAKNGPDPQPWMIGFWRIYCPSQELADLVESSHGFSGPPQYLPLYKCMCTLKNFLHQMVIFSSYSLKSHSSEI